MPNMPNLSPDIRKKLQNMNPEQQQLFMKFKDVATAKTPQEKQMAFMKFLGFLKKQKGGGAAMQALDPNSAVKPGELGGKVSGKLLETLGGGLNG